jgi:hypothetical protein
MIVYIASIKKLSVGKKNFLWRPHIGTIRKKPFIWNSRTLGVRLLGLLV